MRIQTMLEALHKTSHRAEEKEKLARAYGDLYPNYVHEFLEAQGQFEHYHKMAGRISAGIVERFERAK